MANTVTFGEIKELALNYADMENSDFPTPARLNQMTNIALSKTRDLIIDSHEDYFRTVQNITLIGGTEAYSLPTDYYKTLKMFYTSGGRRFPIRRYTLEGLAGYDSSPVTAGSVEHWYVPQFTDLVNDNDVVDVSVATGWEDYAALLVACRLAVKGESPMEELKRECMEAKQHLIDMASTRDTGTAIPVADVTRRWNSAYDLFPYEGRQIKYRIFGDNVLFSEFAYLGA